MAIAAMVLWQSFQPKLKGAPIKGALRGREAARKNLAGRKRSDEIAILTAPLVRALDNLSGGRNIRGAIASRSCGLSAVVSKIAGAKTLWLSRAALAKAGAAEELFDLFLKDKGDLARASAGSKRISPGGEKRKARRAPGAKGASGSATRHALHEEARALVIEPYRRRSPAQIHTP